MKNKRKKDWDFTDGFTFGLLMVLVLVVFGLYSFYVDHVLFQAYLNFMS